eukprot:INCI15971.1.p1 GENE.INCI15971.1~~INCI15971.1.p1  ORF type:complete len:174 (-),score=16.69 INCI15971.1:265-786(-)
MESAVVEVALEDSESEEDGGEVTEVTFLQQWSNVIEESKQVGATILQRSAAGFVGWSELRHQVWAASTALCFLLDHVPSTPPDVHKCKTALMKELAKTKRKQALMSSFLHKMSRREQTMEMEAIDRHVNDRWQMTPCRGPLHSRSFYCAPHCTNSRTQKTAIDRRYDFRPSQS